MNKDTLVVLTYAPAGLGHLRVVNAIAAGLPETITPVLLGSSDVGIESMHKFMSINPYARSIMEWLQGNGPARLYDRFYRNYLIASYKHLFSQIVQAVNERLDKPKKIVFVCTHFGLAHKLSMIRKKLETELDVKVYVIVQVTDDSPQYIWYVPNVDLISVPSQETKNELEKYAREEKFAYSPIEVLPYPVNPLFGEKLSQNRFKERADQLYKVSNKTVHIACPISGAAVGMEFYYHLINRLTSKSRSCCFHVVSRLAPFTKRFLDTIKEYSNVKLYVSSSDKEVVDLYEELYKNEVISLEVTKPSEQTFKALLSTEDVGGSILLFSRPVGRQEYDNLEFLRRHGMLFPKEEQEFLWQKAEKSESISELSIIEMFDKKMHLRGIELPMGSDKAANFIWWCLRTGIFERMLSQGMVENLANVETRDDGVKMLWERVEKLVSQK
jgi:hypothetical protein